MGKRLISLLILISSILGSSPAFSDGEARQVQRELRKRHLFFGAEDGKITPALTLAIKRYQEKKGFPPTGLFDPETLASLGFVLPPRVTKAEVMVIAAQGHELRGANGEQLPLAYPAETARPENAFVLKAQEETRPENVTVDREWRQERMLKSRRRSQVAARIRPQKETNPLVLAYRSVDRAMRNVFAPPAPAKKKISVRAQNPKAKRKS